MSFIEDVLKPAIANRELPGAVLLARDLSGDLKIFEAHGFSTLDDAPGGAVPLTRDAVFPLMSVTKLMTAVAVLHAAEAGTLDLDEDVGKLLPELASQPVLKSMGDSSTSPKPVLVPRTRPLTLRHLMTHSSGCTYEGLPGSPIAPYLATLTPPRDPMASYVGPIANRFTYPIIFEPGTDWIYGTSLDWAAIALERAAGCDLETYMQTNVWEKVGVRGGSLGFYPDDAALEKLWGSTPVRGEDGKIKHAEKDAAAHPPPLPADGTKECSGGVGIYGEVGEFFKVMVSLLLDDGKILKSETVKELFRPQLEEGARKAVNREMGGNSSWITGWLPDVGIYDHALGGLVWNGEVKGHHRRKGAMMWGGMYNSSWIIDREAGLCALFATSLLPPGDAKTKDFTRQWEEYVYKFAKK